MSTNSIEELENNFWKKSELPESSLIKKCFDYRKIKISELTNEQIRFLISQNIGTKYLIKIALKKLENNILTEGDLYEGDLLNSVLNIKVEFWSKYRDEFLKLEKIINMNKEKIILELGEKELEKIEGILKASYQHRV